MTFLNRFLLVPLLLAVALPAQAEVMPNSDDALVIWRNFQLTSPTTAAGTVAPTHDTHIYFIKQWWLTPQAGLYFFYGTQGTTTIRAQGKLPLGGRTTDDGTVVPPWMTLTGMAGYRAIGMGSSLATFSTNMRDGPEVAAAAALPLGYGLTVSANASYAAMFGASGASAGSLVFYGANLNWQALPTTSAGLGLLGSFLAPFSGGLIFHDLGPTLTVSHRF